VVGEVADGAFQERGAGRALLVIEDLGVGQPEWSSIREWT
jgi:hypothetical protein